MKTDEQGPVLDRNSASNDFRREGRRVFKGSRRKPIGPTLLVFEHTRHSIRLACVARTGESDVHIRSLQSMEVSSADLAIAIRSLCESVAQRPQWAVVVSSDVNPAVYCEAGHRPMHHAGLGRSRRASVRVPAVSGLGSQLDETAIGWVGEDTDSDPFVRRCVVSRVARATRHTWIEHLRAAGVDLAGLYPLAGCPIAAMDGEATRSPTLCLQIETDLTAVVETDQGGCRWIEVFHQRPSLRQCMELVGTACPEVLLFGGGDHLRPLGLELALSGTTWVRILKPAGVAEIDEAGPESLGSIIGAARHAFGIAPPDAMACVPAVD